MLKVFGLLTLGAAFFMAAGLLSWGPWLWLGAACLGALPVLALVYAWQLASGRIRPGLGVHLDR